MVDLWVQWERLRQLSLWMWLDGPHRRPLAPRCLHGLGTGTVLLLPILMIQAGVPSGYLAVLGSIPMRFQIEIFGPPYRISLPPIKMDDADSGPATALATPRSSTNQISKSDRTLSGRVKATLETASAAGGPERLAAASIGSLESAEASLSAESDTYPPPLSPQMLVHLFIESSGTNLPQVQVPGIFPGFTPPQPATRPSSSAIYLSR